MVSRFGVASLAVAVLVVTGGAAAVPRLTRSSDHDCVRSVALAPPNLAAPLPPLGIPPSEPLPPSKPSVQTPTLAESGEREVELRITALASELKRMWTRDSSHLVATIDEASRKSATSPSVTLLLAIAHAETNGKVLDISEAGAVGLAQATPIAYLQEGYEGPVFITDDYLVGARAYIMKKPLGDADTIASDLIERHDAAARARAKRLLAAAKELRRDGVDDFELLRGHAPAVFFEKVERADRHNEARLTELGALIDRGTAVEFRVYRDEVRKEYRDLKKLQMASWSAYQKELMAKRDALLAKRFKGDVKSLKRERAYEVGEILGRELDQRFSPTTMAAFLVRHLNRKAEEARGLGVADDRVEELTAALYNGGSPNVRRMLVGLIGSLPETENYMKKVPSTRRRLEATLTSLESQRRPAADEQATAR